MSSNKGLRRSFSSSRSRSVSISSTDSSQRSGSSFISESSSSSRSKSNKSKHSKSELTSDSSSDNEKEINVKEPKKHLSSSKESLTSFNSLNSVIQSEDEFQSPEYQNMPLNVLQLLLSIRTSETNIKILKSKHEKNLIKLKFLVEKKSEIETENQNLTEELFKEASALISLNEVVYGQNFKTAWSHINLALIYLECKNLPKQAKFHCEEAWKIQIDCLKTENSEIYLPDEKHEMILNFVYGRACTLLKVNKEAEDALEKAEEHLFNWKSQIGANASMKKLRPLVFKWQKKVLFALAKTYAINGNYKNALIYYERLTDLLTKRRDRISGIANPDILNEIDQLLVDIYDDRSKVEQNQENFREAADAMKEAIRVAETNGSLIMLANCKFNLARIYNQLDDITSCSNAENLLKECTQMYESIADPTKILKCQDEMVRMLLKQERYDEGCEQLNIMIKKQIEIYGDFSLKVSSSYKILCSVYLKKNDMPNAAKYLQKSLELDELNYGPKNKKTMDTKETLENFKKNPNVQEKLKNTTAKPKEKPNFTPVKRIDYTKNDRKLYSAAGEKETLKKLINPLK